MQNTVIFAVQFTVLLNSAIQGYIVQFTAIQSHILYCSVLCCAEMLVNACTATHGSTLPSWPASHNDSHVYSSDMVEQWCQSANTEIVVKRSHCWCTRVKQILSLWRFCVYWLCWDRVPVGKGSGHACCCLIAALEQIVNKMTGVYQWGVCKRLSIPTT